MGPDGSTGGDYDFFGGSAQPVPPTPSGPPAAAGPAVDRFGNPAAPVDNRYGSTPVAPGPVGGSAPGQFGAPAARFGAPATPAVAAAPSRSNSRRSGMPTWAIALIALAAIAVAGVVAAVVIPGVLGSDVEKAWKRTTVAMPASAAGYSQVQDPATQQRLESAVQQLTDEDVPDVKVGVYRDGTHTLFVAAGKYAEPQRGSTVGAQQEFVAGLQKQNLGDVGSIVPVGPGELGGSVFCARIVGETQLTACGATDIAAGMLFVSDDPNLPGETVLAMRQAIEQR